MATIWTIEDVGQSESKIFEPLSMNFPVRRIASTKTFLHAIEIEPRDRFPNLVIVNDQYSTDEMLIYKCLSTLQKYGEYFDFLVSSTSSKCWIDLCHSHELDVIEFKHLDSFDLKMLIDDVISNHGLRLKLDRKNSSNQSLEFGDVRLEKSSCEIEINGSLVDVLSPKEMKILELLIVNSNTCVLRKSLADYVWPRVRISNRTMDSHISRLRKKLEKSVICTLESVYGKGYSLRYR